MNPKTWIVRPATTKMLAALYGVSRAVIKGHVKRFESQIGPKIGNYYMVNQVIAIIDNLGPPPEFEVVYPNGKK
jgi:hypothetical protein